MKFVFIMVALAISVACLSQKKNDVMLGIHADLIKSDNDGYFEKVQTNAEFNYFFLKKFTFTGGIAFWSNDNRLSLVVGSRFYPAQGAFLHLRGLIGVNAIAVGGGWAKPLNSRWQFEALGDFYTGGSIAIRAGFTYLIGN